MTRFDLIRIRRRRRDSLLTRRQVFAAHKLYWEGGMSVQELADKLGYATKGPLYRAFLLHGLPVRSRAEAARLRVERRAA